MNTYIIKVFYRDSANTSTATAESMDDAMDLAKSLFLEADEAIGYSVTMVEGGEPAEIS